MTGYPRKFNKKVNKLFVFALIIIISLIFLGNGPMALKGCSISGRSASTSGQTSISPDQGGTEQVANQQSQPISKTTNTESKIGKIQKLLYLNLFIVVILLVFEIVDFLWRKKIASDVSNLKTGRSSNLPSLSSLQNKIEDLTKMIYSLKSQMEKQGSSSSQKVQNAEKAEEILKNNTNLQSETQTIKKEKHPLDQFVELYNKAVKDPSIRNEFNNKYKPIRMGVTNYEKRRVDPKIDAIFENWESGDYLIVEINLGNKTEFVSVPRFDLPIQDFNYGPGAIGEVFECPNYNPKLQYLDTMVVRPAFFEKGPNNEWNRKAKGELKLGQGKEK